MKSFNLNLRGKILWLRGFSIILIFWMFSPYVAIVPAAGIFSTDYFEQDTWSKNDIKKNHVSKILPLLRERNPNQRRQALEECKYIFDRLVNHPHAFVLCGLVEQELKVTGWLVRYYERAIRLHPKYGITFAQYGLYLANVLGKPKEGISKLEQAISVDPKLKPAYVWLAKLYNSIGEKTKSRKIRDQAREHGILFSKSEGP